MGGRAGYLGSPGVTGVGVGVHAPAPVTMRPLPRTQRLNGHERVYPCARANSRGVTLNSLFLDPQGIPTDL